MNIETPATRDGQHDLVVHAIPGGAVLTLRARTPVITWMRRAAMISIVVFAAALEAWFRWRVTTPTAIAIALLVVQAALRPSQLEIRIERPSVRVRTALGSLFEGQAVGCSACAVLRVGGADHGLALHTKDGVRVLAVRDISEATAVATANAIAALLA